MHKGALSTTTSDSVDISPETKAISSFLTSQTGLAYYAWVDEQSARAEAEGRGSESWRLFFLYLAELSNMTSAYSAALRAADVELLFDQLSEKDLKKIASLNSDLVEAIASISVNREGNVVTEAFVNQRRGSQNDKSRFAAKLQYLKDLGIDDPNIDLFLAVVSGDENVEAVKAALAAGANIKMTDSELLEIYKKELKGFAN